MVDLVALLEPAEDGDGVLHRGLVHEDGLEPAFERRVLLDVLAVLVERRRPDEPELAARQHGLDHVAGVHRPFGPARADDGVELVDERDDLAVGVGDLLEHRLEALFELAPVLRPGHHGREVERHHTFVAQPLGHVALDDAVGEALHDGGLAHTRLADEHGIVLGAAAQYLNDATDLLVPADDRVELAPPGQLRQVAAVTLERLVLVLRVLRGDAVATAHLSQRVEQLVALDPDDVGQRQDEVLDRHVLVAHVAAQRVGGLEQVPRRARQRDVAPAVGLRKRVEALRHTVGERGGLHARLGQQRESQPVGLTQQRHQDVVGGDLGVVLGVGALDGRAHGLLDLERPPFLVNGHDLPPGPTRRIGLSAAAPHQGLAQRHEITPVLTMRLLDSVARLVPDALELGPQAFHLGLELQHVTHPFEVQPRAR